jgi:polyhydroxyalkanoate synthase
MTQPSSDLDASRWLGTLLRSQAAAWQDAAPAIQAWQQGLAQTSAFWSAGFAPADAPASDRRFAAEPWQRDPRFAQLSQGYLQLAALMRSALDAAPLDERSKAQWSFALRQVLDAMSPANCLATNPEALQGALDTGGASLLEGARLFLADLTKGRVSMSDDKAVEVGRDVATSPGSVVFENELMQFIQYAPATARVHKRPLVIVPPCINKFYILDLQPDNSLVAYAVAEGHTVFLVSWRNVSAGQGHLGWDDYVEQGVLQALDVARRISRADKVNTLGLCIGGTLLGSALAVAAARGEQPAASLTLLTAMLDFSDAGELGLMVDEALVVAREATIGNGGLLRGRELATVFAALRANDLIWPYVVNGYLKGEAPPAFDLLYWNGDDTNLPGPMYCWYLRNTYLENKLCEPGARCNAACRWTCRASRRRPSSTPRAKTTSCPGRPPMPAPDCSAAIPASCWAPAVISRASSTRPRSESATPDAQAWLDGAQSIDGSWWPAWRDWLGAQAGVRVAARAPGSAEFPVIEPAPGRYVKTQAA